MWVISQNSIIITNKPLLEKSKHKRILGKYPHTDNNVICYIGQYGPVASTVDPTGAKRFAPLKDVSIAEITFEQALELLKYPQNLGTYKDKDIILKNGKYGEYIVYNNKNINIGNVKNINLQSAIEIIQRQSTEKKNRF